MKRILMLGGSYFQVPAIEYARKAGYYVITCDYLPKNPGHKLSHEYHNISTVDKESVLALAERLRIDGILAYASDPAAPTAAYVAEKLGLPGNSYESILILSEKHLWRKFLRENGFNVPSCQSFDNLDDLTAAKEALAYPVMVKPVDSSGSKGVRKVSNTIDLEDAFKYALSFSRGNKVIVEQYLEKKIPQIGGDGFFGDSKLDFVSFGDQVVDITGNPFVPCGMTFPSLINSDLAEKVKHEIERALCLLNVRNLSFNLEVYLDMNDDLYLMEIGPRNGGNYIPDLIRYKTGVDLVGIAVEAALGNDIEITDRDQGGSFAYYAIHSNGEGSFEGCVFHETIKSKIIWKQLFINEGDLVKYFNGSNATVGIILLQFSNNLEMVETLKEMEKYVQVKIKKDIPSYK